MRESIDRVPSDVVRGSTGSLRDGPDARSFRRLFGATQMTPAALRYPDFFFFSFFGSLRQQLAHSANRSHFHSFGYRVANDVSLWSITGLTLGWGLSPAPLCDEYRLELTFYLCEETLYTTLKIYIGAEPSALQSASSNQKVAAGEIYCTKKIEPTIYCVILFLIGKFSVMGISDQVKAMVMNSDSRFAQ
ncbi:hypothetical protein GQ44DRAFT_441460 [Phaeosphaeriaceae sp. PMI808]|nr:hypothetical protein GQ44DRAFT_441460 [Phaeosphaeriaceae sp. PMI808]